jgi:hypothetical protein
VLGSIALISFGSLLVVWVAYPLVMSALAALAVLRSQRGDPPDVRVPTVSIVIATRDDAAAVQRRVDDCARYSYDPAKLEVVVAIDRSVGKETVESVRHAVAGCTLVIGDRPGGKSATLNAAVNAARGEVLVFTDTHQRFESDAIHHLVTALADPRVGASSGSLELGSGVGPRTLADRYWSYERTLRRNESRVHSPVGVTGAIWALRRSLWTPLPEHLILDDVYAPMRVVLRGCRVSFSERARTRDATSLDRPGIPPQGANADRSHTDLRLAADGAAPAPESDLAAVRVSQAAAAADAILGAGNPRLGRRARRAMAPRTPARCVRPDAPRTSGHLRLLAQPAEPREARLRRCRVAPAAPGSGRGCHRERCQATVGRLARLTVRESRRTLHLLFEEL